MTARVVVLGGNGFFGRHLVDDLLAGTDADIVIASRHATRSDGGDRIQAIEGDIFDRSALRRAFEGADVVAHCAGPFHTMPILPLDVAIEVGAHYVDIAEDREFGRAVSERAAQAEARGIAVLSGCSVVPTLSIAAARFLAGPLTSVEGIRTFVASDTARQRGRAMFETTLWGAGRHFDVLRDGRRRPVYGWSEPEWVTFPPPVGRRLLYLALEMSDLVVTPELTGAGTVEFKGGSEHAFLNRVLGLAARLRARRPSVDLERLLLPARAIAWIAGRFGTDCGAVMFEVSGIRDGVRVTTNIAVMADHDGGRIPTVPAAMAIEDLLANRLEMRGVIPPAAWLTRDRLLQGLWHRDLRVLAT